MSEKRDFYEVLNIGREASPDDIRKAYRQLALKYHPDRNPGDTAAEAAFKEATEAYSVLSDSDKRATYDRFGHAGLEGRGGFDVSQAGMGDILSHFQDLFSDFFGGFGGGSRSGRGTDRGQDVLVELTISLKEAMLGQKREVVVRGQAPCETCSGSGAKPGERPQRCVACGGTGQVATQRGFLMFAQTCPRCRGRGEIITAACESCGGNGHKERQRKVLVTIPPGIDSGQRLRVPGQGMPGKPNGPAGDLYVDINVESDPRFRREGSSLAVELNVSFAMATLGGKSSVTLPDESEVWVNVAPGTQPGTVVRVRGQGMPPLDRRSSRGDLHVIVNVTVPKKLNRKAKKLLEELDRELGNTDQPEAAPS